MAYCNLHCIYGGCAVGKAEGREEGGLEAGSVYHLLLESSSRGQRVEETLQMLSEQVAKFTPTRPSDIDNLWRLQW